ncbi:MAG: fumarylacetoacetate hydrolase family protein [Candidatus Eremiobacteraeota bacterium]|nr:fumarylacetoacetate hydrolase family protein [Candidatus Eremiobacteraeota bacterium]
MARFVSFERDGRARPGFVRGDRVFEIACESLRDYIALDPPARERSIGEASMPLDSLHLAPPVVPSKNVFCVGRNYLEHAKEGARAAGRELNLPSVPTFFSKSPTSVAAPGQTLRFGKNVAAELDWEAELAIVIGARVKNCSENDALDAVFGFTCCNDITARDLQRAHGQWLKGKSLDDACPLGPWIVAAEDVGDPQMLDISLYLNGERKQYSNTAHMIFSIPRIIAELSKGMTLEPGDVIATGTPDGVGFARTPPEFFRDGDEVEVRIDKVGSLRNRIQIED